MFSMRERGALHLLVQFYELIRHCGRYVMARVRREGRQGVDVHACVCAHVRFTPAAGVSTPRSVNSSVMYLRRAVSIYIYI